MKDGKDLLPASKVNKITPTPQTSTGSARYGASLFNFSTILSASTAKGKGKEKETIRRKKKHEQSRKMKKQTKRREKNKKCRPQAQHKANSHTSLSTSSSFPILSVYIPPISQNQIF